MPKDLHDKLKKQAKKKGLKGKEKDAYIYGTMRKTGWKPDKEKHETVKEELDAVFLPEFVVNESTKIVLDGEVYLLEAGDKIKVSPLNEGVFDILMDVGGLIPGIGEPIDFVNGVRHLYNGNYFYAAISFIAMIPGVGDGAKVLKYLTKAGKIGGKASKFIAKILPKIDDLWKAAGNIVSKLSQNTVVKKIASKSEGLTKVVNDLGKNWDKIGKQFKNELSKYVKEKNEEGKDLLRNGEGALEAVPA